MNSEGVREGVAAPQASPAGAQLAPSPIGGPYAPSTPHPYPQAPYPHPGAPQPHERSRRGWSGWVIGSIIAVIAVVGLMAAIAVAVIGGFIAANVVLVERTATTSSTYTVTAAPNLVVTDPSGNVTFQSGMASQVTVAVTKHARGNSAASANSVLSGMVVDVSQSGNTITVSTRFNNASLVNTGRRNVDLVVTVPAESSLDLQLGAGNVTLRQISGLVALTTGAGNVTLDDVTLAGASRISTGAGNVGMRAAISSGAAVNVHVGAGDLTVSLPTGTPARLEASTGVGNLTLSGWPVSASQTGLTGHHASGDLSASPTATLTMDVGTGNLTLTRR